MRLDKLGSRWKEAYAHFVETYQITYAMAVAQYYRPQKLYKYFDLDPQYWRKNIYDGDIVFNDPVNYNDPMDSRWFLDYERIVRERYRDAGMEWDEEGVGSLVRSAIPLYEEDLIYLRHLFKISCFSESPCSNLMWGHYGGRHRGFCLEYDVEKLVSKFKVVLPVIYTEKPFQAWRLIDKRGISDPFSEIIPCLYKSSDWSYEQEWRTFIPSEGDGATIASAQSCISGIFFGLKSYFNERKEIEAWARKNNVTIYQMERTYCSYDFVYDTIDDLRQGKQRKGLLL